MSAIVALRAVVVIDYQNVHLTAHGLFQSSRDRPKHETLVDPLHFANQLIEERNRRQRAGHHPAVLTQVLVFRGEPAPQHDSNGYARNQAQKSHWERDPRVTVTLRPLKYDYLRDADGRKATDHDGKWIVKGPPREKGVDVLCALAMVRAAQNDDVDLVILASSDSDLAPAIDEVLRLGTAKVETCCWYDATVRVGYQIHPTDRSRPVWNTRLNESAFVNSQDLTDYA